MCIAAARPCISVKHLAEGHAGKCQQQADSAASICSSLPPRPVSDLWSEQERRPWLQSVTLQPQQLLTLDTLSRRMLEVTTPGMESQLGVNFAEYYNQSPLAK